MPSPELKAQADDLTKDATTDVAKAQVLYQWVARNIRYVSLSFGTGRYQPHYAAEVLTNRYGDCKDKATLLEALLDAEGIHSSTALIRGPTSGGVDRAIPGSQSHGCDDVTQTPRPETSVTDRTGHIGYAPFLGEGKMPWKECSLMDERLAELCREFGTSRKTGYKIFDRYQQCGSEGLTDRGRRPYRCANRLPFQVENFILNVKREHTRWGARKIRERLIRRFGSIAKI
jgi:Transglutaminase-like superfamily/Homeodomain-like domain